MLRIGLVRSTALHSVRTKPLDSPMVANQKLDSYWTEVRCCRMQVMSNWDERRSMRVRVRCWAPLTKERIGSAHSTRPGSFRKIRLDLPSRRNSLTVAMLIADYHWTDRLHSKSGCPTPATSNLRSGLIPQTERCSRQLTTLPTHCPRLPSWPPTIAMAGFVKQLNCRIGRRCFCR